MERQLKVVVKDSLFDPNLPPSQDKQVHYWRKSGEELALYKVWLYLEGEALPYVQTATYRLDRTIFADSWERRVERSLTNPNCQLVIWTWRAFGVEVVIEDATGAVFALQYSLSFAQQLEQAEIKFVPETENPLVQRQPRYQGAR